MKRYEFPVVLIGHGTDMEDAWNNALEGFCEDSGPTPEEGEYTLMEELLTCRHCGRYIDVKELREHLAEHDSRVISEEWIDETILAAFKGDDESYESYEVRTYRTKEDFHASPTVYDELDTGIPTVEEATSIAKKALTEGYTIAKVVGYCSDDPGLFYTEIYGDEEDK